MKRIVVTGASGLIGWHAHARLHAANCAAQFKGFPEPYDIVALDHASFQDDAMLRVALTGADAVLHFAGVNRAPDDEVETGNPAIARRLAAACGHANISPHIVYANSTHAASDTTYGRSKRIAGEVLDATVSRYSDLVLAHVFGEGARPFYNNVTATLIARLLVGEVPELNSEGQVQLLHAGAAAQAAIDAIEAGQTGLIQPAFRRMSVLELFAKLQGFHELAQKNIYPDLSDPFDVALFNSYRAATYPDDWPRLLRLNTDARGTLFEAVKGGGGGQCFLSTTEPGVTRGDHFHLDKVERFLVVQGEAVIRIRKVISDVVWEYPVNGAVPAPVDMPTLHTHSIENVGEGPLLTLFWTHDLFDPQNPDTYADKVLT
ncbi:NAD-dependent epimerase/dehydratase family protein [Sulfitobacter geojensis]|uniref:NAD-dependent epimerase/dehydratase family protein n=1 Tax=Sulfitobacter geojensis TaxID=1342299 RepID=A0AAE2VY47_9RHOB|nr:NAD-dependent epimerase/dehydratase family protein [Sulfitobacter geojensis]MBM1689171.1 NAD-dependent epimerase/dehydratase family protein [Sulfitobacter geojensis]MBM1693238.1 NAD-dependent epimerase/dehydratase family protein [Sulfitobacter geojensis]MBM1705404.1 NAD-dependent epimerase/dehydratase family protein [Sulfitobacter geojensis]MBM1709462.1 NAD-dependent epimerase/dehydratase family protein [Sulfitobacter geojensis]MBM1713527.1 NAD-dependent epimerase/dehydratase family protein